VHTSTLEFSGVVKCFWRHIFAKQKFFVAFNQNELRVLCVFFVCFVLQKPFNLLPLTFTASEPSEAWNNSVAGKTRVKQSPPKDLPMK
jgi:hypothetical protein